MKKIVLTLTAAMIFSWQGISFASSSVDALIQKLEDKGILTDQDANQLKGEIASHEQDSQQATFKSMLPDWLNTMKLTGDMRLRYQYQRRDADAARDWPRNRGRYRGRLQVEDQLNDKMKVIFGIATDGGSGRSNNVTFGGNSTSNDAFGKGYIVANKVYAIYTPTSFLTLKAGKMDNPIWEPTQVLWDPNITPEGGDIEFQKKLSDYLTVFSTSGIFVLHDASPSSSLGQDPYMMFTQNGIKGNLTEKAYYKLAMIYYNIHNPSNFQLTNSLGTNTIINGYGLRYSFNDVIGGAADVGLNDPFGELLPSFVNIPQVGVMGQFTDNRAAPTTGKSWMIGGYMGNSAINGWGTWRLLSGYKVYQRDSWLDSLPDADFYSGMTDAAGYRTEFDLGLAKNVWMTVSFFDTHVYKKVSSIFTNSTGSTSTALAQNNGESLLQADLNFRF